MNISFAAGVEYADLLADGACCLLKVFQLDIETQVVGVQKHSDRPGCRNRLAQQPKALRLYRRNEIVYPGYVAARPVETGHDAVFDWIITGGEDDRNRGSRLFCRNGRADAAGRSDQGHPTANEVDCELRKAVVLTFCPPILDSDVLTFAVAAFPEAAVERRDDIGGLVRRPAAEEPNDRHRRLLRARRERPASRRAAE